MNRRIMSVMALVVLVALLTSCKRSGPERLHIVYVIDLTASTIEEARAKALDGVKQPFDKGLVKRGDSVTVIPITGDALVESQGLILRFDLPTHREVYDDDLRILGEEVALKLQELQEAAAAKPYLFSDILGAVRIANEEFAGDKPDVRKVLVILSDFIEDEQQLNFKTSPIVANEKAATAAAKKLAVPDQAIKGTKVYLGWLQSTDLKKMPTQRRDAVRVFWAEYFKQAGAKSVQIYSDGPGQLTKFIATQDLITTR